MKRRQFLQSAVASSVVASLPVRAADRDWTAMGLEDPKPIQPNFDNVHATGRSVMVSTDHPYATEAALWALERGGTAADAYMTAALVQCVLEPTMTTIGGGFGMAFWDNAEGQLKMGGGSFAFPSGVPAEIPYDEQKSWTAWGAMVPGYVRGLEACSSAFGKLSWAELFEPAIEFAENGFVIDHLLWGYTKGARKMVGRFPGTGRDVWFRNGYMLGVGDKLVQKALAETLRRIRDDGPDYFYDSPFSQRLADAVQADGGGITADDLKNFNAVYAVPVWQPGAPGSSTYHDFDVAPVTGGLLQLGYKIFERAGLRDMGHPSENVDAMHLQMRVMQEMWIRGRDYSQEKHLEWISDEHADKVLDAIRNEPTRPFKGFSAATCALAIVDADGNVAAGTHSSSSESYGTGINVDGVVLNRATYIRKFTDMPKGFSTATWLFKDGKPALATATPSRSFMECMLQAGANVADFGMDLEETVNAKRFGHPHPGMTAAEIEGDIDDEILKELENRGHHLFRVSPNDANMGSIHAVRIHDDGLIEGAADPRRRGQAKGH